MIQISLAIFKHFQICLNFNKNRCTNSCVIDRHHVCAICIKNYIAFHCFLIKQFDFWLLYHLIIYFNNNLSKIHLNINFHISFKIYFNMNLFFEVYSNMNFYFHFVIHFNMNLFFEIYSNINFYFSFEIRFNANFLSFKIYSNVDFHFSFVIHFNVNLFFKIHSNVNLHFF